MKLRQLIYSCHSPFFGLAYQARLDHQYSKHNCFAEDSNRGPVFSTQQRYDHNNLSSFKSSARANMKLLPCTCYLRSGDHRCDLILVYGDTLHALLSSTAVDLAILDHVDGSLEAEVPVMFFCKDDLALHLRNKTHRDDLEDFLAMLLAGKQMQTIQDDLERQEEVADASACSSPIAVEYGSDGEAFLDSSETEPLLPQGQSRDTLEYQPCSLEDAFRGPSDTEECLPEGMTGEKRTALSSRLVSIKRGMSSPLRDNYRRIPEVVPVCPPKGDCSTCRKCEKAVELEW